MKNVTDSGTLDPITMQVVRDTFEFISEEMSRVVERSAVHPLFQEVHDYSTGVFYYDGNEVSIIARATAIPVHIFASLTSVQAVFAAFGDDIHDGDLFLVNDPYHGGSHAADWTMMRPVLLGDGTMVIPSIRAHMSDFGGVYPGGYSPELRDSWQEGYRISPVRLIERGVLRHDLWALITGNSRLEKVLRGDLMALVGGCNVGARRTEALIAKYGAATVKASIEYAMDYAAARFREKVESWPDGEYHGECVLDHDFAGTRDITVRVAVTVAGDRLLVDFEGSDPETPGFVNSSFANTASYVFTALYATFDDDIPVNSGVFRQVEIRAPEGSVVNPLPPAPVMLSTVVIGGHIGEAMMNALEKFIPERVGNVGLHFNVLSQFGRDGRYNDDFYFMLEYGTALSADGGAYGKDGWGAWASPLAKHTFANCETQELQFPLLYEQYEYLDDSCAPGRWRGCGTFAMRRRVVGERPAYINVAVVGNEHPMPGYAGGLPGGISYTVVKPGTPDEALITESLALMELQPGESVYSVKGGGGGWGPPHERDPQAVLADFLDGWVSLATARDAYGVALSVDAAGKAEVDDAETARLRAVPPRASAEPT